MNRVAHPEITASPEAPAKRDLDDIISSVGGIADDAGDEAKSLYSKGKSWVEENASHVSTAFDGAETWAASRIDEASSRIQSAKDRAETAVNDNDDDDNDDDDNNDNDDNDNAAGSFKGQAGLVAAMVALGATAFGFILA